MEILQFLIWPFVASLILTGIHAYLGVHVVETVHPVCHPTHIVFRRYDFQRGKPLKHAAVDEPCQTLFNNVNNMDL